MASQQGRHQSKLRADGYMASAQFGVLTTAAASPTLQPTARMFVSCSMSFSFSMFISCSMLCSYSMFSSFRLAGNQSGSILRRYVPHTSSHHPRIQRQELPKHGSVGDVQWSPLQYRRRIVSIMWDIINGLSLAALLRPGVEFLYAFCVGVVHI